VHSGSGYESLGRNYFLEELAIPASKQALQVWGGGVSWSTNVRVRVRGLGSELELGGRGLRVRVRMRMKLRVRVREKGVQKKGVQ
jgi:hypothetical protein